MYHIARPAHRLQRLAGFVRHGTRHFGRQVAQALADDLRWREAQHLGHLAAERFDAAIGGKRDHAVPQMLQDLIEPATALRLAECRARHFQRCFERALNGRSRVEKHRLHAGLFREFRDETRPDNRLHAAVTQIQHAGFRVLRRHVGRAFDRRTERAEKAGDFSGCLAVHHETDRFALAARTRERMHDIEPGRVHQYDRNTDSRLQVRPVRSGSNDHIWAGIAGVLDLVHRVLVTERHNTQIGNAVVFGRHVAIQIAELAYTYGPDAWRRIHGVEDRARMLQSNSLLQTMISFLKFSGIDKKA